MASIKAPKILFFISGAVPTLADRQTAAKMVGAQVMFRNASRVGVEHSPEIADGVAGAVIPDAYKAFPSFQQAMETHKAAVEAETAKFAEATHSLAGAQLAQPPVQQPAQPQPEVPFSQQMTQTHQTPAPVQQVTPAGSVPLTTAIPGAPQFPGSPNLTPAPGFPGATPQSTQPQAPQFQQPAAGTQAWTPQTTTQS